MKNKIMAQLIDKSALVAEIERRIDEINQLGKKASYEVGLVDAYKIILSFIDTLEVKEVDLNDFIKEEFNKYSCVDGYGQLSVSYNMAEFYSMIKRLTKAQKGE